MGLTLTYAIGLMGLFQWGVRQSAEVENQVNIRISFSPVISLSISAKAGCGGMWGGTRW